MDRAASLTKGVTSPIRGTDIERFGKPGPGSTPTIVRAFKSAVTKRINESRGIPGAPVWQRNDYDHIIRNMGIRSRKPIGRAQITP